MPAQPPPFPFSSATAPHLLPPASPPPAHLPSNMLLPPTTATPLLLLLSSPPRFRVVAPSLDHQRVLLASNHRSHTAPALCFSLLLRYPHLW
ncbi:hypothetical protein BVRB_2g037770 [Beta vulgaris subsp. vulgaris]|nr:hypothetical protein BVRB_2g037770 [Beta vulgaris subsp. vulgaris]